MAKKMYEMPAGDKNSVDVKILTPPITQHVHFLDGRTINRQGVRKHTIFLPQHTFFGPQSIEHVSQCVASSQANATIAIEPKTTCYMKNNK